VHKPPKGRSFIMKKRLLTFALAISIIGVASAVTYASQSLVNSTKNKVVTVDNKGQSSKGKISDEEAVKIATNAMKIYMGYDANFFSGTSISRFNIGKSLDNKNAKNPLVNNNSLSKEDLKVANENAKKLTDNLLYVRFTPVNWAIGDFIVYINERTSEVTQVMAHKNTDKNLKGKIDDNKVYKELISFFKRIGKNINPSTIRVDKNVEDGLVIVKGTLKDGRGVLIQQRITDYAVVDYYLNYNNLRIAPTLENKQKNTFRELKIN
jgi:hypothetical protein